MTMQIIILSIGAGILIAGGLLVAFLSWRNLNADDVTMRLNQFVAEETPQAEMRVRLAREARDLQGSLTSRLTVPIVRSIGRIFGRLTPATQIEEIRRKLTIAGNPLGMGPREFYGMRVLTILLGGLAAMALLRMGASTMIWLGAIIVVILGFLAPVALLDNRVRARQDAIRRGLPDALDMLSVCASAGLGFDQAIQRVSEHWGTPVGQEFGRMIQEMEMGLSRKEALRNMADRLDVNELSSFVAFVLQSEQLGMSIADTLHTQAAQMRQERRFRAQEQAQKIPTKMLFPMALLIFPAIIAVVLGPALPRLMNIFSNF